MALAPSLAEICAEVGVEDRLAAVSDRTDTPPSVARLPKVGGYYHINIEAILAAKPDLLLMLENPAPLREAPRFRAHGIPVVLLRGEKKHDIAFSLRTVGALCAETSAGEAAARRFLSRYESVRRAVAGETRVRVYLALGDEGLLTAGRSSYMHDLLTDGGGENIAGGVESGYPRMSMESILAARPEAILFSSDPDSPAARDRRRARWSRWRTIPAVRDGRLLVVNAEVMNRPGPRAVEALAEIARALHPKRAGEIAAALR